MESDTLRTMICAAISDRTASTFSSTASSTKNSFDPVSSRIWISSCPESVGYTIFATAPIQFSAYMAQTASGVCMDMMVTISPARTPMAYNASAAFRISAKSFPYVIFVP